MKKSQNRETVAAAVARAIMRGGAVTLAKYANETIQQFADTPVVKLVDCWRGNLKKYMLL